MQLATWTGLRRYAIAEGAGDLGDSVLPVLKERPIRADADAYYRRGGLDLAPNVLHDHSV